MIIKNNKTFRVVAVIPARGGSKRIPLKNIKLYAGKPLIYWSIKLAKESKFIDDIIVTTDCENIKKIVEEFGIKIPFLRPQNISNDLSTDYEFMEHYIDWAINEINTNDTNTDVPDIIVQLRPTYPNRKLDILDDCINKFAELYGEYDSLRTVCKTDKPPYKMYTIANNELIPLFRTVNEINEPYNMPAQILPVTFWHNGYIDIFNSSIIKTKKSVTGDKIYPYIMDSNEIDDIDTDDEWNASEAKFSTN